MTESHRAHLSLGTNIQPEVNLVRAVQLLGQHGDIAALSSAWESRSVGADGPNYLNACLRLVTPLKQDELKQQILLPIEQQLGRRRTDDKFAPRPMDIDIVLFDGESCAAKYWEQAFVVVPLAEIHPKYKNPLTGESIRATAARLRRAFWMEARRDVLRGFHGNQSAA